MEILNADLDIDLLEFCDRTGKMRSTSGCSFRGKVEFDARLRLLSEIIKEEDKKTIAQVYQGNEEFAHHCDRCLKLNGIKKKWLTEQHLVALLFAYKGQPGMLVKLNAVSNPSAGTEQTGDTGHLYHQFLGALYRFTENPEQAFRLAEEKPFKEVMGMIRQSTNERSQRLDKQGGVKPDSPKRSLESKTEMSDRTRIELMAMRGKIKSES